MKPLKNQIIKGTFILSLAGIITRIIGFYYRIFLSNVIGATGMGLYQMIFPIFGLCHSFAIFGIQMSVSRFTAIRAAKKDTFGMYCVLKTGLLISLLLSSLSAFLLFYFSDLIALNILDDIRCSDLLKIISLSIPIGSLHSCISGYYLGKKNASVSAVSQLVEQIVRVAGVYVIAVVLISENKNISPSIAVWGLVLGEGASALLSLYFIFCEKNFLNSKLHNMRQTFSDIWHMAYPLSLNKIATSILSALEAVFIPLSLKRSGMPDDTAISIYGILTGMALPFILFPSTITNSICAMILPSVAEQHSNKNYHAIAGITSKIIKYCLSIGILCTGYFFMYGKKLGEIFFDNTDAGLYISVLSWLCPFLYLTSTLGSILNGMGQTRTTFIHNIFSTLTRLAFIIFLVPHIGIRGCLIGILVSYVISTILHAIVLFREIHFHYNTFEYIIKPLFITFISLGCSLFLLSIFSQTDMNTLLSTLLSMVCGGIIFTIYLLLTAKKDI